MDLPESHIEDSFKLEADGKVDLFQIHLAGSNAKLYLKLNNSVTWQGNTYEGTGIKLEGVAKYSDDQVARPKLTLFNPNGVYNSFVDQGFLDNGLIIRYRILKEHLDANLNIFMRQQWRISRVANLKSYYIVLELRDLMDGQAFQCPGRMFIPPEFSKVSLS